MTDPLIITKIREAINKNNIKKAVLVYITEDNQAGWVCNYLHDDVRKAISDLENKMREFELKEE